MAEQTIFEYNTKTNIMKNHYVDLNGSEYLQAEIYNAITGTSTKLTCSLDEEFAPNSWNSPFSSSSLASNARTPYVSLWYSSDFITYMDRLQSALSRSNMDTYFQIRVNEDRLVPLDNDGNMQKNIRTKGFEWSQEGSGNAIRLRDFGCGVDTMVEQGVYVQFQLTMTPLDFYNGHSGELGLQKVRVLFPRGELPNGSIQPGSWFCSGTVTIQCSGGEFREYIDNQYVDISSWRTPQGFSSSNWYFRVGEEIRANSENYGTVQNMWFEGYAIDLSGSVSISAA